MVYSRSGNSFISLGWTGFIGSLTGMSEDMAISEKVWLSYKGRSSRAGIPFHFLLRDIIHYDVSLGSALTRIANAPRTCSIFVGAGSRHESRANIIAYAHENVTIFDDRNFEQVCEILQRGKKTCGYVLARMSELFCSPLILCG